MTEDKEKKSQMKELLIKKLYDFWSITDDDKKKLLEEITQNINDGKNGAETLLDWCRNDYDMVKEQYQKKHNLTEEEIKYIIEDNCGSYNFMYNEIPYVSDLDDIWDLCNWYLDYLNGDITEEELLNLINEREV